MSMILKINGDIIAESDELSVRELAEQNKHNLMYAYLPKADLFNVDFSEANLSYANLTGAYLKEADFTNANLQCAELENANLTWAVLYNANCQKVNLKNANLEGAVLTMAQFKDTNLYGANIDYVNFEDTNLDGIVGKIFPGVDGLKVGLAILAIIMFTVCILPVCIYLYSKIKNYISFGGWAAIGLVIFTIPWLMFTYYIDEKGNIQKNKLKVINKVSKKKYRTKVAIFISALIVSISMYINSEIDNNISFGGLASIGLVILTIMWFIFALYNDREMELQNDKLKNINLVDTALEPPRLKDANKALVKFFKINGRFYKMMS